MMLADFSFNTTGQDWANHIAREADGNGTICLAILLGGRPDAGIMRQAVLTSIQLQPVLGCRFDETKEPPMWVSIPNENGFFSEVDASCQTEALEEFLCEGMDERQLAVRLVRCPQEDALLIKLDHSSTDGGGAKAYLALLNRLYNMRLKGKPLPEDIPQDRSDKQVFAALNIPDFRMILARKSVVAGQLIPLPYQSTAGHKVRYAFEAFLLSKIKRIPGSTVNDALLAAVARAFPGNGAAAQIHLTVDLRRYLEKEAMPIACNLSGIEAISLDALEAEAFDAALAKTASATAALKASTPGLYSAASMAYLALMPYGKAKSFLLDAGQRARMSGAAAPLVSNLGLICDGEMRFGDVPVLSILPLTPALHAPAFLLGAGSYLDIFILSAMFYEEERPCEEIKGFLKKVRREMTQEPDELI